MTQLELLQMMVESLSMQMSLAIENRDWDSIRIIQMNLDAALVGSKQSNPGGYVPSNDHV